MVELAKRRLGNHEFDLLSAEGWVRNIVLKQPMVFLPIRSSDAFLIAILAVIPWLPAKMECNVALVYAENGKMWQALTLIRESVAWARRRGCFEWHVSSESVYDLAPLARRVGAEECPPRYRVRLR
ncbi:MAG TPA: hypothetical protein VHT52_19365 [Stellaceae bacterium]|jgi:hypothetical protein|nr:hypothetical protein [Stellaceae bacterium]